MCIVFLILLFPTSNNTNWISNRHDLVNTVNTATQLSTTFSSKLAGYCIEQLGALETTNPNQHPSTCTKDEREVIPILSNQEITSYNRLFFAQNEENIDPDGRLCKGAKDSAVDMVSEGFKLAGNVAGSGMYGLSKVLDSKNVIFMSNQKFDIQGIKTDIFLLSTRYQDDEFDKGKSKTVNGAVLLNEQLRDTSTKTLKSYSKFAFIGNLTS